jgi:replicative DNA helicase
MLSIEEINFLLTSNKTIEKLNSQLRSLDKQENELLVKSSITELLQSLDGNFKVVVIKSNNKINVSFNEVK